VDWYRGLELDLVWLRLNSILLYVISRRECETMSIYLEKVNDVHTYA
jgi:hypothetical protein